MVWTVVLESENKKVISSLSQDFDLKSTDQLLNSKLLKYLDPYGDTTFNSLQIDDLVIDLKSLSLIEKNPLIDEICTLALRCKSEPHTYLTFYGD